VANFRVATRPESPDRLHTDANCLLGIVTIRCDVDREFAAERVVQNSGDPLTIRLTMRADSKSLTTFFRNQGVYLFIAFVIGAIFRAMGEPIHPFTVILYSLCIGNFLSPPMQWLHAFYPTSRSNPSPCPRSTADTALMCSPTIGSICWARRQEQLATQALLSIGSWMGLSRRDWFRHLWSGTSVQGLRPAASRRT
jgi:hypothetical protein